MEGMSSMGEMQFLAKGEIEKALSISEALRAVEYSFRLVAERKVVMPSKKKVLLRANLQERFITKGRVCVKKSPKELKEVK